MFLFFSKITLFKPFSTFCQRHLLGYTLEYVTPQIKIPRWFLPALQTKLNPFSSCLEPLGVSFSSSFIMLFYLLLLLVNHTKLPVVSQLPPVLLASGSLRMLQCSCPHFHLVIPMYSVGLRLDTISIKEPFQI